MIGLCLAVAVPESNVFTSVIYDEPVMRKTNNVKIIF